MSGGVFICYRREDSASWARLIYDRLSSRLKREQVFIDVDNIEPGLDFVKVLSDRVGDCDALVAVIGKDWLSRRRNRRRLDDPNDFVRIEIEAALTRNIRVIPVLVDGAAMPREETLPDTLKALARRQKIEVSHDRFNSDVERLTNALAFVGEERRKHGAADESAQIRVETATRGIGRTRRSMPPTPQAQNAPLAFMSYVPEDSAAVKALSEKLEGRGVRIWRDRQHLHVGDLWNQVLFSVIKRVGYVIVVQTPAMVKSVSGAFNREIEAAQLRQSEMDPQLRFLIPIRIGFSKLLPSLEDIHVIDVDVAEPDGADFLASSILEDWDKRARFGEPRQLQ